MSGDTADTTAERSGGVGGVGGAEPRAAEADGTEELVGTRQAACLKRRKAICLLPGRKQWGLESASV